MSVSMYCIVKRNTNITLELEKQFFNFKGWIASSELEKEMFSIQDFLYVLVPYIRRTNLHFGIIFCSDYLLLLSSGKKKSQIKKYNNRAILPNSLHSDNCKASSPHSNLTENIPTVLRFMHWEWSTELFQELAKILKAQAFQV